MSTKALQLSGWAAIVCATQSLGLGIRIADQDPLATARGNAFVATADNPSALYYNPAGITQLQGQQLRGGLYGISLGSQYHSAFTGGAVDSKNKLQGVPQFYYTISPKEHPVSFGLGLYSPYGLSLEWPESSGFRTLAIEGKIIYMTLNPVVAWKVTPALSIAAGPTINFSQALLRTGIVSPAQGGDELKFRGDDVNAGFNLGLLWKASEQLSFGVSYRSESEMNYQGHLNISNPLFPFVPLPPGRESASARFEFPQNVIAGVSWRPTPKWNLEFNYDWTDWDVLNTVNVQGSLVGALPQVFNWRSSAFYEFGATYHLDNGMRVSGGYIFSENSVPTTSFNPIVPDSDRHIFSLGLGGNWGKVNWDAAYQLAYGPDRMVSGGPVSAGGQSADGTYRFLSHAFTLSFGYAF